MTNTTREQRLRELVEKWRSVGPDEEPEYRRPDGVSVYCADELAAILAEPVEVTDEMCKRAEHAYYSFRPKSISPMRERVRHAITAALKEPGQ